jgi:SSS family solute:Na+ symporter
MIPDLSQWNLGSMLFMVYFGFLWIMAFPTGGFYVQRLLSTKNEQEATKAFLWYNFAHYVLRSWPWIVVGMLAMVYFPSVEQAEGWHAENSYAMAISQFLPVGLKGLMVAAFLAAYMSTISTHLNWGTSYVVHDLYEGFINKNASRRQIIRLSRACMVGFLIFAAVIAAKLTAMLDAYKFLTQIWAGMGLILVARWYWWRVTAGAEFVCLFTTLALTALLNLSVGSGESARLLCQGLFDWVQGLVNLPDLAPDQVGWLHFATRVCIITFAPLLIWIPYAFLVARTPDASAVAFYKKMRIASFGWRRIERLTGLPSPEGEFKMNVVGWLVTCFALYGVLLVTGSLIFQQWGQAAVYLPIGIVASIGTWKIMSGKTFKPLSEEGAASDPPAFTDAT